MIIRTILSTATLSFALIAPSNAALTLLGDPVSSTASSFHSAPYVVSNLYDGNPTLADVGTTAQNGTGQYAGNGPGPHYVVYNMGSSIDLSGIVYAQRLGGDPATDKVVSINFWLQATDPGTVTSDPAGAADHTLTVTNTANNNLALYDFGSVVGSGQYVTMKLTGNGGNPGGSQLQLGTIPEPGSAALLGLAGCALALRRRRR